MAMELTSNSNPTARTPETDGDASPPAVPFPLANGQIGRRHLPHLPHPPPPAEADASYKECLKNHAARLGGHALDGCGEFMPSPSTTPADPASLRCAACSCHRNFHRRESPEDAPAYLHGHAPLDLLHHHTHLLRGNPSPQTRRGSDSPSSPIPPPSPPPPPSYYSSAPHKLLVLRAAETESPGGSRKRSRTRFSQEQKEKMRRFAERLGWKMPKGGSAAEGLVGDFCDDVGVCREVLKVWMHNNKHAFGRPRSAAGHEAMDSGGRHEVNLEIHTANLHASANGSSSSS